MQQAKLSKVALTLLALAATACAPAPGGMPAPTTSTAPVGGTPTAAPSTPAQPGATPTPTAPGATPSATVTETPISGETVVVSGTVYDAEGAPVDNAMITVKSLSAQSSYTATTTTNQGSYVLNKVPEGLNVEIIATKDGWTSRRRVGSFQSKATLKNIVDFGGASSATSADAGVAYFISKYPEILKTEPADDATNVDPGMVTVKLTLSEALDDTNRRRFEDAIRILPANGEAGGGQDLETASDVAAGGYTESDFNYAIKKSSLFQNDSTTKATVAWNADNTEATLTFKAPLQSDKDKAAKYNIALVAGSSPIEDKDGNQLGTDSDGSLNGDPTVGKLILNAFKEPDLALEGSPSNLDDRWAATHDNAATFEVKEDDTDPVLTGVEVNEIGQDTRIEMTFSEPMMAYPSAAGGGLNDLSHFTFAVGETADKLSDVDLDGNSPKVLNSASAGLDNREEEFAFNDSLRTTKASATTGDIYVEVDPKDAKRVFLVVKGVTNLFDTELNAIKARVEGVSDPAGNDITASQADKAQVTGSI